MRRALVSERVATLVKISKNLVVIMLSLGFTEKIEYQRTLEHILIGI